MRTEAIERAGIDGTAAGTGKSAGGDIADFFTADSLMDTILKKGVADTNDKCNFFRACQRFELAG